MSAYKKLRSRIFNVLGEYLMDSEALQATENVMSEIVTLGLIESDEAYTKPQEVPIPFNVWDLEWFQTNILGPTNEAEEELFNQAMIEKLREFTHNHRVRSVSELKGFKEMAKIHAYKELNASRRW